MYLPEIDGYDFTEHLTRFGDILRKGGMVVGPREISSVIESLTSIDFDNKLKCYLVLKSLFVSEPDQISFFDLAFERFWAFRKIDDEFDRTEESFLFNNPKFFRRRRAPSFLVENQPDSENVLFKPNYLGASKSDDERNKNIEYFALENTVEMKKLAIELVRSLKGKKSRRPTIGKSGNILNVRKLLRSNMQIGSEPLYLSYIDKKIRPPKLTILLDVSGSMDKYVKLLLRLCFECASLTDKIDVHVFSKTITRITSELRLSDYMESLTQIGYRVKGWSGGTAIGDSLAEFRRRNNAGMNKNTIFVLMSDGWDTGSAEKLYQELSRIKHSVKTIVWLNPLLGAPDFSPETASMKLAVPLIDILASARDFESLKKLPSYIS